MPLQGRIRRHGGRELRLRSYRNQRMSMGDMIQRVGTTLTKIEKSQEHQVQMMVPRQGSNVQKRLWAIRLQPE